MAALVGEDEGDAEQVADESGDAAGGAEKQFAGGVSMPGSGRLVSDREREGQDGGFGWFEVEEDRRGGDDGQVDRGRR